MGLILSILSILVGAGLLYYGVKYYATSLSLAVFIPGLIIFQYFGLLYQTPIIILSVVSLIVFIFSKPLSYFVAGGLVVAPLVLIGENLGINNSLTVLIYLLFLRKKL